MSRTVLLLSATFLLSLVACAQKYGGEGGGGDDDGDGGNFDFSNGAGPGTGSPTGGGVCGHDLCIEGAALEKGCSDGVNYVCNLDAFCCDPSQGLWDKGCVQKAAGAGICIVSTGTAGAGGDPTGGVGGAGPTTTSSSTTAGGGDPGTGGGGTGGGATGPHDVCLVGDPLTAADDPCAGEICLYDASCCDTAWDADCTALVPRFCGKSCGASGVSGCAHAECVAGGKLATDCSDCAGAVCAADPFCCTSTWDADCVAQVPAACGATFCD